MLLVEVMLKDRIFQCKTCFQIAHPDVRTPAGDEHRGEMERWRERERERERESIERERESIEREREYMYCV